MSKLHFRHVKPAFQINVSAQFHFCSTPSETEKKHQKDGLSFVVLPRIRI
jgi:hypothetical protein